MQGMIIYRGPSEVDGSPIVVIVSGLMSGGKNSKTGPMPQIYIMRSDMHPFEANQNGSDYAICGNCKHRGKVVRDEKTGNLKNEERTCYVVLMNGPHTVYQAFRRGDAYQDVPLSVARRLLAGRKVRIGAYGDPGAVPILVWETILAKADPVGYTTFWRTIPALKQWCMASVSSDEEYAEAVALGWRTYRVRRKGEPVLKGEGKCPASKELGKAVQCTQCMLCNGLKRGFKANITIEVHGNGAKHFEKVFA